MNTVNDVHPREIIKTKPITDEMGNVRNESRAYLVISQNIFHQNTEKCICLPMLLDSEIKGSFFENFNANEMELQPGARFNQNGKIDCSRIITFSKGQIETKYPLRLSENTFDRIIARIRNDVIG